LNIIDHWDKIKEIEIIINLDGEYNYPLLKQAFKTKKNSEHHYIRKFLKSNKIELKYINTLNDSESIE